MSNNIADIRKDYKLQSLSESDALPDPFALFEKWWKEALEAGIDEVNAMTLATASADGMPDARIVLLKGFDPKGFTFFTNYDSVKGAQLLENPRASLVFFWKELERQVRISGLAVMVSEAESEEYFNSRPENSRIGAWASPQSQPIASREWLEENERKMRQQFSDGVIKRPPNWGGYRVRPTHIEFWQGRPNRLHDRLLYSLQIKGDWKIQRLAP
ncbi:pyridoxamine 5'-phosphate oxidase [Flavitalea sp. BT771]|uniref:pyridoxamine 5'-phosphate oxidase n=1 Tax=Flavitalea sp. BT771 TaxID=3063329 RepID=UPI0026E1FE05|nr:pyridoxamine 5'-phosphate oxidase [Flavitalea sp. BT771]MDO6433616.1 pyridoxamine 5'-phosphate oxidase [Flavitalea sp. BT771]MDV6222479.1 pyridoxamine 5'-phosphate oxidase [Flavitalea sp. BT771]